MVKSALRSIRQGCETGEELVFDAKLPGRGKVADEFGQSLLSRAFGLREQLLLPGLELLG